jgi:two-component system chemotaxis sensor kinase CheA
MARLVRDLSQRTGKSVRFETSGEETEIDRNIVDVLGDPLVHMIRNSVDHGIEPSHERVACGKPPVGTLTLSARHSGGSVIVELRDDGRGLDRDRIVAKAISRGLIESDRGLSDAEIHALIFEPGFSTAERVTDVSGRGVGMDVVRQAIESLHGRIDIASSAGRGCTFTVRLPLTLAITDGMLVAVGSERYILPTGSIALSFRPERQALSTVTERGEMVMLRGELMPMYRLHQILEVPDAVTDPARGLLVLLTDGERRFTLLVDQLLGQQQVVAKSLGELGKNLPAISGAAILGDGRVGLILDPGGIALTARQSSFFAMFRAA